MKRILFILAAMAACTSGTALAQQSLPATHPKYKTIQHVFDDIDRVIGNGRKAPRLVVRPRNADRGPVIAWYCDPIFCRDDDQHIGFEEKTYDLLTTFFGADSLNALAVVLGHELAHYYLPHTWIYDFGNRAEGTEIVEMLKDISKKERLRSETQADDFGGFYTAVAGYSTLHIAPAVLDSLYASYQLDLDSPDYPTLEERKQIAEVSVARVATLLPVFEAGHRLLLLGEYEDAARCFDFIAQDFPSRDVWNNAGVARALEVIRLSDRDSVVFFYPFELDADTRLRQLRSTDTILGFGETIEERRTRLLQEAIKAFEQAKHLDPTYATAQVNLASAYDLQGEHDLAFAFADKALRIAQNNEALASASHARIVRGIASARRGQIDAAHADFEAAKAQSDRLATQNIAVLTGEAVDGGDVGGKIFLSGNEKIEGFSRWDVDEAMNPIDTLVKVPRMDKSQRLLKVYVRRGAHSEGILLKKGPDRTFILSTKPTYTGRTQQGIEIGSTADEVEAGYGIPSRMIAARQGTYYVYDDDIKIIFHIDANDVVRGWMIFLVEKEGDVD